MQGPVDGPEPIMVGYLDKFSMTGLVKVRAVIKCSETPAESVQSAASADAYSVACIYACVSLRGRKEWSVA